MADSGPVLCPRCGELSVEFDYVPAVTCCTSCGYVVDDVYLDSHIRAVPEAAVGTSFVGEAEGGSGAVRGLRTQHGTKFVTQQKDKLKAQLRQVAGRLGLQQDVCDEAQHTLQQILPVHYGQGKTPGDILVAVALYITCRSRQLPFTAGDLADVVQCNPVSFGRAYLAVVKTLGVSLPAMGMDIIIRRAVTRLPQLAAAQEAVVTDALLLLKWLQGLDFAGVPLAIAAGALNIAAQAHAICLGAGGVGAPLHVSDYTVTTRTRDIKQELLDAAKLLPWVTEKNVAQNLALIIKLSDVLRDPKNNKAGFRTQPALAAPVQPSLSRQRAAKRRVTSRSPSDKAGQNCSQHQATLDALADAEEVISDSEWNEYIKRPSEVASVRGVRARTS